MSDDPRQQSPERRSVRRWTIAVIVGLFLVIAPPFVGLAGTVYAMIKAFKTLGMSEGSDPTAMAEAIGEAIMSTAIGFVLSAVAFIPLIVTIFGLVCARRRLLVFEQS